jgi:hypothetical protein
MSSIAFFMSKNTPIFCDIGFYGIKNEAINNCCIYFSEKRFFYQKIHKTIIILTCYC